MTGRGSNWKNFRNELQNVTRDLSLSQSSCFDERRANTGSYATRVGALVPLLASLISFVCYDHLSQHDYRTACGR